MTPLSRCLPGIAILLAAISSPVLAEAREQRPDSAGYPCRSRDQLVVKSVDHDFAIVRRDPVAARQDNGRIPARAQIKLGTAHKIDRSIFLTQKPHAAETIHAHR
ncbi:hypothetical protein [Sphingopyxis alaskensis]|jgi:hypothetical protein|uniref:hypothetical protein n=1 Tax=Sphingopyxis alaskensis TaxID=117207 RepID=UPI00203B3E7C|nr:hypothetical protein [Sphingopyxis alaskensis]MCM3420959.1 hypothetical protein [Sphingopyxis alaskensis]